MKPLIGTKIYNTDSNSGLGSELNDVKSCSEDLSLSPADTLQLFGITKKRKKKKNFLASEDVCNNETAKSGLQSCTAASSKSRQLLKPVAWTRDEYTEVTSSTSGGARTS